MAEPITERGWYRLTDHGWERVADSDAIAQITAMADGYQDLVFYEASAPMVEIPLF